jgi:hypothetical protein
MELSKNLDGSAIICLIRQKISCDKETLALRVSKFIYPNLDLPRENMGFRRE